jgi:hypothetical protein
VQDPYGIVISQGHPLAEKLKRVSLVVTTDSDFMSGLGRHYLAEPEADTEGTVRVGNSDIKVTWFILVPLITTAAFTIFAWYWLVNEKKSDALQGAR